MTVLAFEHLRIMRNTAPFFPGIYFASAIFCLKDDPQPHPKRPIGCILSGKTCLDIPAAGKIMASFFHVLVDLGIVESSIAMKITISNIWTNYSE
jgi:hypothetical protein